MRIPDDNRPGFRIVGETSALALNADIRPLLGLVRLGPIADIGRCRFLFSKQRLAYAWGDPAIASPSPEPFILASF